MKFFSKILFVFTVSLLFIPSFAFASPAEYIFFDSFLTYNSSCKLVATYDLKIIPNTMTNGNTFKFEVVPIDPVTDNPQTASGIDYPISVPVNGVVTNGTIQTTFTAYQEYKLQIVEYAGNTFLEDSDPIIFTPAVANCGGENNNSGGSQGDQNQPGNTPPTSNTISGSTSFNIDIDNPISVNSIPDLVQKILEGLIKIGIPLLVVMIVYSGFLYLFARGEPGKISAAHDMLKYTLIGGAILLGAWALAQLIHTTLIEITASIIQYFV